MKAPLLYTLEDAGELLGVSARTVQKYIADGELRVVSVATKSTTGQRARLRIRGDDLAKFIEHRTATARKTA